MVDNDALLAKCPELKDMRNATEFVIACVTQNLRLKEVIELAKAATGDAEKLEKDLVKRLGEHRASVAERTQQIQRILKGMIES